MSVVAVVLVVLLSLLLIGLVVVGVVVVVCFCLNRKKKNQKLSEVPNASEKEVPAGLNIVFPLPKPENYETDITMDETQYSGEFAMKSRNQGKWMEDTSSKKSEMETKRETETNGGEKGDGGEGKMGDESEKSEKSTKKEEEPVVSKENLEEKETKKEEGESSALMTTGPISAGFTPKVARQLPQKKAPTKASSDVNVDPESQKQPTPLGTAKDTDSVGVRSLETGRINDEGVTPMFSTSLSQMGGQKMPSTDGVGQLPPSNASMVATFTPADDSSLADANRRPENPFRQ